MRVDQSYTDPISPVRISHEVDETVGDDGELEYHYNFITYYFEREGISCNATYYLHDHLVAAIHGPFGVDQGDPRVLALKNDVLEYLKRRFLVVKALSTTTGAYRPIWQWKSETDE